jgi:hypothetical protein
MTSAEKRSARRRVWRMTKGDPQGAYIDADRAAPSGSKPVKERTARATTSDDERQSGWAVSSFELKYGLDVGDVVDTVPSELLDRLFNGPKPP